MSRIRSGPNPHRKDCEPSAWVAALPQEFRLGSTKEPGRGSKNVGWAIKETARGIFNGRAGRQLAGRSHGKGRQAHGST